MEEKKKKSTVKKTSTKNKDVYKKGKKGKEAIKKEAEKKATKKVTAKKTTAKKTVAKKTVVKKVVPKEEKKTAKAVLKEEVKEEKKIPKVEEVIKEVEEEEEDIDFLEKTLIFDGKDKENLREVVSKLEEETVVSKDRIVRRNKSKKIAIICLAILIGVVLFMSTVYVISSTLEDKRNKQTINSNIYQKVLNNYGDELPQIDNEEKEEVVNHPHIHTISLKEFESKILKKEKMVVLIASDSCLGCMALETDLEPKLSENEVSIYRLSITAMDEQERNRLRTYYYFSGTPEVFVVKDGIVTEDGSKIGDDEEALINWIIENSK